MKCPTCHHTLSQRTLALWDCPYCAYSVHLPPPCATSVELEPDRPIHGAADTGEPDTEDITYTTGSAAGLYIVSERNNASNAVSRNSILRFDPSGSATSLNATNEWNLTADLPVTGANLGVEGITWIPDAFLVTHQFSRPASMPNLNNEGFAISPQSECVAGRNLVYWSDDSETGGHSIRRASITCTLFP
ncbi:MAG: hypothetical protein V4550_03380 [Gemmatimonadota bacterium]